MAETPSGLTTTIRRKLQEGRPADEIVDELVAGGLTQASAQRFVERAMEEGADAPDQFVYEPPIPEKESEKTGFNALIGAGVLMSVGIIVSAVSYLMADVGERYFMLWGTTIFGALMWGQAVFRGRDDGAGFAWRTAIASLVVPIVLGAAALGLIAVMPVDEEAFLQKQMDEIFDPTKAATPTEPPVTFREPPPLSANPGVEELLSVYDNSRAPVQCEMVRRLSLMSGDDAKDAVSSLVPRFGLASNETKLCIARAVRKLDPEAAKALTAQITSPQVRDLVRAFETAPGPATQCETATKLGDTTGSDAAYAVETLMRYYGVMPMTVQSCMRDAVLKLDPTAKFPEPNRF